jgi:two-component system, response regulator PdtaR
MNHPRILIVEDDPLTTLALREIANYAGFAVVGTAATVIGALDIAQSALPDVAVIDVRLAGRRDGIAGALLLRREFDIQIVFLSAHMDAATRARAAKARPVAFLVKPCSAQALLTAIHAAFDRARGVPSSQRHKLGGRSARVGPRAAVNPPLRGEGARPLR